jgi:GH43 family beta-xylosidase
MRKAIYFIIILQLLFSTGLVQSQNNFFNPIRSAESPDPWVIQKDGFYYLLVTTGDGVWIHKSDKLENVGKAPRVKVWSTGSGISYDVWAPELHYLNNKWYIYTCGAFGTNGMRLFVLEGDATDALKPYTFIGLLNPNSNAIDANVWQDPKDSALYMTWSQWASDQDQSVYIAKMKSPTELMTPYVKISSPTAEWEQKGWNVNEGPAFIKRNNKLHIIISVSGCSTSDYALARLTCSDGNYLNASSWTKSTGLVFKRSDENKVWGTGHHGFTKSPDGKEDWLVYHAKSGQINTNSDRSVRIQKFTWDIADNPVFGEPYPTIVALPSPSDGTCTNQEIIFNLIPDKTVDDAYFDIVASSTSGNKVIFLVQSGPATISGNTVHLLKKPGTVRIVAMQSGDNTYCTAWPVFREFLVKSQSIQVGTGNGLNATYYSGVDFINKKIERIDSNINFDWGAGSPDISVPVDNFSANWKGYIQPLYSDVYYFSIVSDNGRKMTVNNTVIIDHLNGDYGKEYVGSIYLNANQKYPISIDYIEDIGGANIRLCWWSNNQIKEIIPQKQLYALPLTDVEQTNIKQGISIYPNPAKDFVNISTDEKILYVSLYSCTGQKLNSFSPADNKMKLSIVNYSNGLYIIETITKTEKKIKKILIQH